MTTKKIPSLSQANKDNFWSKVDRSGGLNACWLWTAYRHPCGYGMFALYPHGPFMSNRLSYFIETGVDPGDLFVLHRCDNPPCCNPSHLFLGTQTDNNHDRSRKGRSGKLTGEASPNSRLTNDDILEIRVAYGKDGITYKELSDHFGVTITHIWKIVHNLTWSEV